MPTNDFPKLYRFMREFADYQKKRIEEIFSSEEKCGIHSITLRMQSKEILLNRIDMIIKAYQHGFVTVSETMKVLSDLDYNIRMGVV